MLYLSPGFLIPLENVKRKNLSKRRWSYKFEPILISFSLRKPRTLHYANTGLISKMIWSLPFAPNYLHDTFVHFLSLTVFPTLGIIPLGPANILCIVSNFIYSFYTLYFTNNSSSDINKISVFGKGKCCFDGLKRYFIVLTYFAVTSPKGLFKIAKLINTTQRKKLWLSIWSGQKKKFWWLKEISIFLVSTWNLY